MVFEIPTRHEEFTLLVKVETDKPEKIRLIVKSADVPKAEYTNRYKTVNGEVTFFVRIPFSSNNAYVVVYNERVGNVDKGEDDSFKVLDISKLPLEKKMDVIDFKNVDVRSFVAFCVRFCFNAGNLTAGTYKSSDGKFTIQYLPTINNFNNTKELNTPARINSKTGIIQVSKSKFLDLTIPARMAIMLHEFSHYYLNTNMKDESEADLNGLLIYLGLGFPRIEAYEAFLKTFENVPTQQNKERYDKINNFINNFENNNYLVYD